MTDTELAPVETAHLNSEGSRLAITVAKSWLDSKFDACFRKNRVVFNNSIKRIADAPKGEVSVKVQKGARDVLRKFRPGKIRACAIEQLLGKGALYHEVIDEVLREDFAVRCPETEMLMFDDVMLQDGGGVYTLSASVYPLPHVQFTSGFDPLQVELTLLVSEPADIDTLVREKYEAGLRASMVPTETGLPIGIEQGARCTITGYRDGVVFAPACAKNLDLYTGGIPSPSPFVQCADYLLIGLKTGDIATREIIWWDDKPVTLRVEVLQGLWLRTLEPEEAARFRNFESCNAWKAKLYDEVVTEDTEQNKRSLRRQFVDTLYNTTQIGPIPQKWLKIKTKSEYQKALAKAPDEKTFLARMGAESADELLTRYQSEITTSLDQYLLTRAYGQLVGLTFQPGTTPEDLFDKVIDWLDQHGKIKRLTTAEAKARTEAAKAKELEAVGQAVPVVEPQALLEQQQEAAPG